MNKILCQKCVSRNIEVFKITKNYQWKNFTWFNVFKRSNFRKISDNDFNMILSVLIFNSHVCKRMFIKNYSLWKQKLDSCLVHDYHFFRVSHWNHRYRILTFLEGSYRFIFYYFWWRSSCQNRKDEEYI